MDKQKLIVVSMDALIYEDLQYLRTKPSFSWLIENGARVDEVKSIYPTLTYPCHATMASGCWPSKHGVINNTFFQPGVKDCDWVWYHDAYKVPDLIDAAKAKGLTTAAIGWPTMGKHPNLDWIIAEIAHTSAKTEAEFKRDYQLTGTTDKVWEEIGAPNIHWRTEAKRVGCFNARCCCDMIRKYQPDVILLHVAGPDAHRHKYGVFPENMSVALDECEMILTWILEAMKDAGVEDCTNLVITADHGQLDVTRYVSPNVLLKENGFMDVDEDGTVRDWQAWSHSVGMCTAVYVKNQAQEEAVYSLLKANEGNGYSQVYTREEINQFGYDGPFSFVLETDGVTHYNNDWQGDYITPHELKGAHGHHPDKGPRPPIVAVGPAFKKGAVLQGAELVDGATTWAHVLGADLPEAQGRVLTELLVQG